MTWKGLSPIIHLIERTYLKGVTVSLEDLQPVQYFWQPALELAKWDITIVPLWLGWYFLACPLAGLSGNNAIGEITLSDGRVIRAIVFRINGQSIVDNQPYDGVLLFAPGRFNSIGPGRRDR